MARISRILCPVDFSEFSRHALAHAVAIARWYGAELTALHVLPYVMAFGPPSGEGLYPPLVFSDEDMHQFRGELASFVPQGVDFPVGVQVVQGSVATEIVRSATELSADLLVMGTHGRSGFDRLMLGSMTEKLLRQAPCPVLTVPKRVADATPVAAPFTRVICGVDFSPPSLRALELAQALAGQAAARLWVMHVLEPVSIFEPVPAIGSDFQAAGPEQRRNVRHRLEQLINDDARAFTEVTEVIVSGKPYKEILRVAAEQQADLIVLGAHGGPLGLPAFGSTTNHVVREAVCPVLTVYR